MGLGGLGVWRVGWVDTAACVHSGHLSSPSALHTPLHLPLPFPPTHPQVFPSPTWVCRCCRAVSWTCTAPTAAPPGRA